jgi:hypothetical protein
MSTVLDAQITDVHCLTDIPILATIIAQWNAINRGGWGHSDFTYTPTTSGWSGSASYDVTTIDGVTPFKTCSISISVTRSATGYSFTVAMDTYAIFVPAEFIHTTISISGTYTLDSMRNS